MQELKMVADFVSNNIELFIADVREDSKNPVASEFGSNISTYHQYYQALFESLDFDIEGLHKLKKCVKLLYEAGQEWHQCEQDLVLALDQLAGLNAAYSLMQNVDPDISTAWLKFCVIFKDLSVLTRSLFQSVKNNLVFPIDNLLKGSDVKEKHELKKRVDKAFKDYESKLARCEKEHKMSLSGHLSMSKADVAENLILERTILQYELCKFFAQTSKIRSKKGTELLQHLVDFYHTQESFYREGLKTVEEFRSYVEQLIDKLADVKRKQDDERRQLNELAEILGHSPFLKDTEKTDKAPETPGRESNFASYHPATLPSTSSMARELYCPTLSGYLWKQSVHKVHKRWLKRKCLVENGAFFMWHSDEGQPPVKINLLTTQFKVDKAEKKCFDVVCVERTYRFQAEDERAACGWFDALTKNREFSQREVFHGTDSNVSPCSPVNKRNNQSIGLMIEKILEAPDNKKCADCDSTKDVTWMSTNLGGLHCIDCSGIHRELGVQISRVQSINLDYADVATLLLPLSIGNKLLNEVYEADKSSMSSKANFTIRNNARKAFIISKYVDKKFADKSIKSEQLKDVLMASAEQSNMKDTLRVFVSGFDLNSIVDESNVENALFVAVRHESDGSHLPFIHFLIQNGADVNRVNASGDTVLHVAVALNKSDVIKLILMSSHVRYSLTNARQETPEQLAHRIGREACHVLLSVVDKNVKSALSDINIPLSMLQSNGVEAKIEQKITFASPVSKRHSTLSIQHKTIEENEPDAVRVHSVRPEISVEAAPKRHLPPGAKLVLPPPPHPSPGSRTRFENESPASTCISTCSAVSLNQEQKETPKPLPRQRANVKPLTKKCRALFDCRGDMPDELNFRRGEIIVVTNDNLASEDNWLEGYVETRPDNIGLFPITFVTFEK